MKKDIVRVYEEWKDAVDLSALKNASDRCEFCGVALIVLGCMYPPLIILGSLLLGVSKLNRQKNNKQSK